MIKIENLKVYGFEPAIRGMRNPMNSWARSDSDFNVECRTCTDSTQDCDTCPVAINVCKDLLGRNDLDRAISLAKGGPVHAKYRRYIDVYVDITAPLYFWKEFDTYRVGVCPNPTDIEMNSCSTMHKITSKEFTLDDFSCEHLSKESMDILINTISVLNAYRTAYLNTDACDTKKDIWWQLIQLLPSSYNQKRTLKLNYEVLSNMYEFRSDHKLDEWRILMEFFKKHCPYSEIFTVNSSESKINSAVKNALISMKNDIYDMLMLYEDGNSKINVNSKEIQISLDKILNSHLHK